MPGVGCGPSGPKGASDACRSLHEGGADGDRRRAAGTLEHLAKDLRRGSDTDIVARRSSEIAESLTELMTRVESRT
jgi:hypothetical protein